MYMYDFETVSFNNIRIIVFLFPHQVIMLLLLQILFPILVCGLGFILKTVK
jgi:hypothetical protein